MSENNFNDLPEEIDALLQDVKKLAEKYNGQTPSINDREFWDKFNILMQSIKESKIDISMKDLTDFLNFPYGAFVTAYNKYKKRTQQEQTPQVTFQKPGSGEEEEEKDTETEQSKSSENKALEITPGSPLTGRTQVKVMTNTINTTSTKLEPLVKTNVERVVSLGTLFSDKFEKLCIRNGYDTPESCMEAMGRALFEIQPEYEELSEEYQVLLELLKFYINTCADISVYAKAQSIIASTLLKKQNS